MELPVPAGVHEGQMFIVDALAAAPRRPLQQQQRKVARPFKKKQQHQHQQQVVRQRVAAERLVDDRHKLALRQLRHRLISAKGRDNASASAVDPTEHTEIYSIL